MRGYEGPRKRVMVVDDDPVQRGLINDMLTPLGFDVVEARDAEHCLKRLTDERVDLYMLDVAMPGMDGLELASMLRRTGRREPIIMISANAQEPPRRPELGADYDVYLVKPIRLNALVERIGQCLRIDWVKDTPKSKTPLPIPELEAEVCAVLLTSAEVGYERGLRKALDGYVSAGRVPAPFAEHLHDLADTARFQEIAALIKQVPA
jgi:CheY-like chemotaxis protein